MRAISLLERKAQLKDVIVDSRRIRYVEHVDDGLRLFAAAEAAGLEGIVAKKALAPSGCGSDGERTPGIAPSVGSARKFRRKIEVRFKICCYR